MADGQVAGEPAQGGLVEDVGDQAHGLVDDHLAAVAGDYAGTLLATVLQGVEAKVDQFGRILVAEDPADAAFMFGFC